MNTPYVVRGRNAQELRNSVADMGIPVDSMIAQAPILFSIDKPMESAVFGGFQDPNDSPLNLVVESSAWLHAADVALEQIAEALVTFNMPQQLLTLNQSVYLTFVLRDGAVDVMVYYAVRDFEDAALAGDVICFGWAQQRVAHHINKPVGGYQGLITQARVTGKVTPSEDRYMVGGMQPHELDHENLISELGMLHQDGAVVGFQNRTVKKVVVPIYSAKNALLDTNNPHRFDEARAHLSACRAPDLRAMCELHVAQLEELQG